MTISRIVSIVSALALVALIAGILQHRPAQGYHRVPVAMPGDVPATLYYTDPPGTPPDAPPTVYLRPSQGVFRAGVVVAHGFAGDRHTMEGLSESLAGAGYIVLSLDMSGHGLNPNPFSTGENDALIRDIRTGVQFLKQYTWIEPAKIAVLGHSMGASATLDYGTREPGVGGLVMLSGGVRFGQERPRDTLFLYAENDLPMIKPLIRSVASDLAHADPIEERKTYGDFAAGTAVRLVQIPGVAHGTILSSPMAFAEVVHWLDQVTGFPARGTPPAIIKNPLGSPLLWFSFLLVLPGLGLLMGRLAPEPPAGRSQARWLDLGLLPVALLLPLAFLALGQPGVLVGLSLADANVTHLALAGVLLAAGLIFLGRFRIAFFRLPTALAIAATGWLAVSSLLGPVGAYFHGVGLTPERASLTLWAALCLAPFALAMQWVLYRPQWWRGTLLRIAARIVVMASVGAGMALGVFGFPGTIAIFVLIASLVIVELVLAGFYGRSRNVLVAGAFDAIVMGWLFALLLPTTL